jgi:PPK2 family polyphosphate:nucleotide phosphotransferase
VGDVRDRLRVDPGDRKALGRHNPSSTPGCSGKRDATEAAIPALDEELSELQTRLWAEGRRSLLVVLQALDAGGKDGTIRHAFQGLNPQGTHVTAFKAPTPEELAHDFLWRVHKATPAAGEVGIFNRSHYEDVLVVRVHQLVPTKVWRARYGLIKGFEETLLQGGTTIVKLFLHISKEEQRRRFEERLTRPDKRWKFNRGDIEERAHWDDYQEAYAEALARTSTNASPWYVVPADRKWYRNWAVTSIRVETLRELDPRYPEVEGIDAVEIT